MDEAFIWWMARRPKAVSDKLIVIADARHTEGNDVGQR
jgi:hypothetical protein